MFATNTAEDGRFTAELPTRRICSQGILLVVYDCSALYPYSTWISVYTINLGHGSTTLSALSAAG